VTAHVVDGKAADGYLSAHIGEDGDGPEPYVVMLPDRSEWVFGIARGAEFLRGLEAR
jgi:hypothetical protein